MTKHHAMKTYGNVEV